MHITTPYISKGKPYKTIFLETNHTKQWAHSTGITNWVIRVPQGTTNVSVIYTYKIYMKTSRNIMNHHSLKLKHRCTGMRTTMHSQWPSYDYISSCKYIKSNVANWHH